MKRAVLDRSVLSHLYMEISAGRDWRLRGIKAVCEGFEELYYEPEGTSALQSALHDCEWLRKKTRTLRFGSDVSLTAEQNASLTASLHRLGQMAAIQEAVWDFNQATGGRPRELEDVLGYLFRLALLSRSVQAALLCWRPRAQLLRAVLEAESVGCEEFAIPSGVTGSLSAPTSFPFAQGGDSAKFRYALFDYGDPTTFRCSVFLSYSSADKAFVHRLASDLTQGEAQVWLDEAEIDPGDSFVSKIEDGLTRSEFFILILSPDSIRSNWVQTELRIAVSREILGKNPKIIPVLSRDCEVPTILSDRSYVDFRKEAIYGESLTALFRRLGLRTKVSENLHESSNPE